MKTRRLVESATIIAGLHRLPMCYIMDRPRAVVEYAAGSPTHREAEALTGASIQQFYEQCRANGSPAFCGD